MATINSISSVIESWAPIGTAESYDNVGLLLGRGGADVSRALVALDLTPAVVQEAVDINAQLIVTHHPPIFHPIKRVVAGDFVGSMLLTLAENGIAVYSAHTNLDAARDGVSFELATRMGLGSLRILEPTEGAVLKLVTFVPESAAEKVRDALAQVGAGRIGNYSACSFISRGTGSFLPGAGTNPSIGVAGRLETVEEVRLEMEVAETHLQSAVAVLKDVHPYEEVAYDIYQVHKASTQTGMGVIGKLAEDEGLFEFLERVRNVLNAEGIRFTGSSNKSIRTVAVCGGSGGSLIPAALREGADAFVTADLSYHRFFDVLDSEGLTKMALVDPGHYETEAFAEELLVGRLTDAIPSVHWEPTGYRTSPIGYYP